MTGRSACAGHLGDDLLGERAGLGRGPDQHGGAAAGHHLGQADPAVRVARPGGDLGGRPGVGHLEVAQRPGVVGSQQALAAQRVEPRGGLVRAEALVDHDLPQRLRDPDPGGAGAVDHHRLIAHRRARGPVRAQRGGQHHRGGALDVVVEGAAGAGVLHQDAAGVGGAEILPVQHRVREQLGGGADVGVDEAVVPLAADPRVPGAQVHVLVQQRLVVGPGVQHDRDDPAGMQSGRRGVDGQFPVRDRDAAYSPVADAQDALGVGGHDQVHLVGPEPVVAQGRLHLIRMIHRQVHAARTAELQAVPLDHGRHRRGVDDRQHLVDVLGQQPVEQHLVAAPHLAEMQALGQVVGLAQILRVDPPQLPLDRRHATGQQPGESERLPFGQRERGTPVQHRRREHRSSAQPDPGHYAFGCPGEFKRTV